MKAHEAAPRHCYNFCREKHFSWAFISLKKCYCSNHNYTAYSVENALCKARCRSNTTLVCGGIGGLRSAYKTGKLYWPEFVIVIS